MGLGGSPPVEEQPLFLAKYITHLYSFSIYISNNRTNISYSLIKLYMMLQLVYQDNYEFFWSLICWLYMFDVDKNNLYFFWAVRWRNTKILISWKNGNKRSGSRTHRPQSPKSMTIINYSGNTSNLVIGKRKVRCWKTFFIILLSSLTTSKMKTVWSAPKYSALRRIKKKSKLINVKIVPRKSVQS